MATTPSFGEHFQLNTHKENLQRRMTFINAHLEQLQSMTTILNSATGYDDIKGNIIPTLTRQCQGAQMHLNTLEDQCNELDMLGNLSAADQNLLLTCQALWNDPKPLFVARMLDHSSNIINMARPILQDQNLSDIQKRTYLAAINMHTVPQSKPFLHT